MFDLSLNDAASPALATLPDRLRAALAVKSAVLATELQARI